jgi:hypothetical protein
MHAEIKLYVEGLNIAVEEKKKGEEKMKIFGEEKMKMELHLTDIVHRQKMKKIKKIVRDT